MKVLNWIGALEARCHRRSSSSSLLVPRSTAYACAVNLDRLFMAGERLIGLEWGPTGDVGDGGRGSKMGAGGRRGAGGVRRGGDTGCAADVES